MSSQKGPQVKVKYPEKEITDEYAIIPLNTANMPYKKVIDDHEQSHEKIDNFPKLLIYAFANHFGIEITPDIIRYCLYRTLDSFLLSGVNLKTNFKKVTNLETDFPPTGGFKVIADKDFSSFAKLIDDIYKNSLVGNPEFLEHMLDGFSGTTSFDRAAMQMRAMGKVIDIEPTTFEICCGLPYVVLRGTLGDWDKLIKIIMFYKKKFCELAVDVYRGFDKWLKTDPTPPQILAEIQTCDLKGIVYPIQSMPKFVMHDMFAGGQEIKQPISEFDRFDKTGKNIENSDNGLGKLLNRQEELLKKELDKRNQNFHEFCNEISNYNRMAQEEIRKWQDENYPILNKKVRKLLSLLGYSGGNPGHGFDIPYLIERYEVYNTKFRNCRHLDLNTSPDEVSDSEKPQKIYNSLDYEMDWLKNDRKYEGKIIEDYRAVKMEKNLKPILTDSDIEYLERKKVSMQLRSEEFNTIFSSWETHLIQLEIKRLKLCASDMEHNIKINYFNKGNQNETIANGRKLCKIRRDYDMFENMYNYFNTLQNIVMEIRETRAGIDKIDFWNQLFTFTKPNIDGVNCDGWAHHLINLIRTGSFDYDIGLRDVVRISNNKHGSMSSFHELMYNNKFLAIKYEFGYKMENYSQLYPSNQPNQLEADERNIQSNHQKQDNQLEANQKEKHDEIIQSSGRDCEAKQANQLEANQKEKHNGINQSNHQKQDNQLEADRGNTQLNNQEKHEIGRDNQPQQKINENLKILKHQFVFSYNSGSF